MNSQTATALISLEPASLSAITDPLESQQVTAVSAAAMSYYKEQNDYENYMKAWRVYLFARRQTTMLIQNQRNDNTRVMEPDIAFTPMQWSRRLKELNVPLETLNAYFDDVIAKGWHPSLNQVMRLARDGEGERDVFTEKVNALRRAAYSLFVPEYAGRLSKAQKMALANVLDLFAEPESP